MSTQYYPSYNRGNRRRPANHPPVRFPANGPGNGQSNPPATRHDVTTPNPPPLLVDAPAIHGSMEHNQALLASQPSSVSYQQPPPGQFDDAAAFPPLSASSPVVRFPSAHSQETHTGEPRNRGHYSSLESRMRRMIVKNQPPDSQSPPGTMPVETAPVQDGPGSSAPRRQNQRARREQQQNTRQILSTPSSGPVAAHDRHIPGPPHSHGASEGRPPFQDRRQAHSQARYNGPFDSRSQPLSYRHDNQRKPPIGSNMSQRPRPQQTTLYNPNSTFNSTRTAGGPGSHGQSHHNVTPDYQQLDYIGLIADSEYAKAQIGGVELMVKDQLRTKLELICRQAVADFEQQTNADFQASTVTLECFGSLATSFATKNSDMDMVLLSPASALDGSESDSPLPRIIEKALLDEQYGVRLLSKTRVPIIKFCESPNAELLERLLETRARWEQEENQELEIEATGPEQADDDMDEAEHLDGSSPTESQNIKRQDDHEGQSDSTNKESPNNKANNASQSQEKSQVPTKTSPERRLMTVKETSKEGTLQLEPERDDPSLESKSDEERIQLYRLAMKEEWYSYSERGIIFDFIRAVESEQPNADLISTKRTALSTLPNVLQRYRPPPVRKLDFPKSGVGIQCDINFSNRLALHNSTLLRCYSYCDPRVRPIVIFIKAWAKKRRINSAYESSLSSYGYVLMVLHYLVNIANPPVLPNLQHFQLSDNPDHMNGPKQVDGYNVHFFRDEATIQDLASQDSLTRNRASIATLVRGFFTYYGSQQPHTFFWTRDCLSLRTPGGIVSKQSKGWTAARTDQMDGGEQGAGGKAKEVRQRYLIAIEDPLETDHNVGRTVSHEGICAIRDEFRRAHRMISRAGKGEKEEFMAEVPERGDLRYRYFGPNPNRGGRKMHDHALQGGKEKMEKKGPENGAGGKAGGKDGEKADGGANEPQRARAAGVKGESARGNGGLLERLGTSTGEGEEASNKDITAKALKASQEDPAIDKADELEEISMTEYTASAGGLDGSSSPERRLS